MKLKTILFSFLFILSSCGTFDRKIYQIGVDPQFYPLNLGAKQGAVNAYLDELLMLVSETENISFEKIRANWDTIYDNLTLERYDGIFSSMTPDLINRNRYSFSEAIIPTGPILVLTKKSPANSLKDLDGRTIVIVEGAGGGQSLQGYTKIIVRKVSSVAEALNQVEDGQANGALLPYVVAQSYIRDLFSENLRIVSPPLTNEGIRLITTSNQDLQDYFDRALAKLVKNGKLKELKEKWGLE